MHPLQTNLTIAIPVYNDARYLAAAIESCLHEAGHIVICDNASTDDTAAIAADYARRYPHVTHHRHAENIGAFENFRTSLFACTTDYFCWVGSHDILGPSYSLPLLEALQADPHAALAAGTIVLIDENGRETGEVTRSHWATESNGASPLERAGACATGLRRDCSIFYGIYRTKAAREAWAGTPCLGFDRAMLVRIAAGGNILYVPQVTFYARNLDKSRDGKTDRERRSRIVGRNQEIPKNVFERNMRMIQTILAQAHTPDELSRALYFIDRINHRYQNRRYYQKQRLLMIAMAVALLAAFLALVLR